MRRLWVRWALLVVFVVALAFVFVNLGEWQLHRLSERETRNATTISNERAPIKPYEQVFNRPITDADQWQRVRARGTFDAEHQFLVRNRYNGDDRGYEVVTPLRTATGTVLVDRGFVAVPSGSGIPTTAPPPPAGETTVVGYVRRNEQGRNAAITPVDGAMRLINSDALQQAIGYPVANGFISVIEVTPPPAGGLVAVTPPELSNGPHFWYAMQWFMFAGIGIFGIVVFIRGDLRDRRSGATSAGKTGATTVSAGNTSAGAPSGRQGQPISRSRPGPR